MQTGELMLFRLASLLLLSSLLFVLKSMVALCDGLLSSRHQIERSTIQARSR
jgi:hypothetical protein